MTCVCNSEAIPGAVFFLSQTTILRHVYRPTHIQTTPCPVQRQFSLRGEACSFSLCLQPSPSLCTCIRSSDLQATLKRPNVFLNERPRHTRPARISVTKTTVETVRRVGGARLPMALEGAFQAARPDRTTKHSLTNAWRIGTAADACGATIVLPELHLSPVVGGGTGGHAGTGDSDLRTVAAPTSSSSHHRYGWGVEVAVAVAV